MADLARDTTAPLGAKAEATHAAIIEAANRLFRTLGYQKTAVADIARDLGMSPANIYRFFPSKAAINEAICQRILGDLSDLAWRIARGQDDPAERLRALFAAMQEQTILLFFHEKRLHDMVTAAVEENWPTIERHIEDVDGAIRHIVMDGQATGVFARLDPDLTARLIHGTMVAFTHPQVVAQCAMNDLEREARGMAEFCLRALRPHPDD